MDPILLSRLQSATATMFHFIFVPLTLGLSLLVAIMETRYVRTGDETHLAMTKFWGKIFLINFALGVVTGLTLEFQFGTNWGSFSTFSGNIFGPVLAAETTSSFFLESVFLGIWIFGWNKVPKAFHAACMWIVFVASTMSAFWIIVVNAWMQHPVGYVINNGQAVLVDVVAVLFQKTAILQLLHVLAGSYILTGFFMMSISAYHLLRRQHIDFFERSFRVGLVFALFFSIFALVQGDLHGSNTARTQPAKLAAMESLWETTERAPVYLFAFPDQENERNLIEIGPIPGLASFLAYKDIDAEVTGLRDIPADERPNVLMTSFAFKGMIGLGMLFIALTVWGWFRRKKLLDSRLYLKVMLVALPLPYVANTLGWIVTEVGRQPWVAYGLLRTSDGASKLAGGQVLMTLLGFILVYSLLGVLAFFLMFRHAKKGPA